jgi:predicted DCC family thiol-disulfide oxidoreductase YuxK
MIFDGDCNFCKLWIRRWQHLTHDFVEYLPSQDPSVSARVPEVSREAFEESVQLIEPDGAVFSGSEAVFRALACNPHERWLLEWYEHSRGFAHTSESAYAFIARHRTFFSLLTRIAFGRHVEPATHWLVRSSFLRFLGVIYLVAFASLGMQVTGLLGENGILPARLTMESARLQVSAAHIGLDRFHLVPTLCWFSASDGFLKFQCIAGAALAVLLVIGIFPMPCLVILWGIYLSLMTIGREFLGFQWDALLLETGLLAVFFAPLQYRLGSSRAAPPSRIVLWLLRWLLFRLMFQSGCVKLLSHDPAWHNLTALAFHYETQPLPTWIGWLAYQLPLWFQKASTAAMFAIELAVPFLVFAPRRIRLIPCVLFIALQLLIAATGNYCFFNLLTIALCIPLLDDAALRSLVPLKWRKGVESGHGAINVPGARPQPNGSGDLKLKRWRWSLWATIPLACIAITIPSMEMGGMFRTWLPWPRPVVGLYRWMAPLRSFNTYGLFAIMTTNRFEIIVQGSSDGLDWKTYEFKYKPGEVARRPGFVAPHQPRLDWQMWFAALGTYGQNPWFGNFCKRLLQGSPDVLALLKENPFPNAPPRYIRAELYQYHFTDLAARRKTGAWWWQESRGEYLPAVTVSGSE